MAKNPKYAFATSDEDPQHRVATAEEIASLASSTSRPTKRPRTDPELPFVTPTIEGLKSWAWDRSVKWTDVDYTNNGWDVLNATEGQAQTSSATHEAGEGKYDALFDAAFDPAFDALAYHEVDLAWKVPRSNKEWEELYRKKAMEQDTPGSGFMDKIDDLIPDVIKDFMLFEEGDASDPDEDAKRHRDRKHHWMPGCKILDTPESEDEDENGNEGKGDEKGKGKEGDNKHDGDDDGGNFVIWGAGAKDVSVSIAD